MEVERTKKNGDKQLLYLKKMAFKNTPIYIFTTTRQLEDVPMPDGYELVWVGKGNMPCLRKIKTPKSNP